MPDQGITRCADCSGKGYIDDLPCPFCFTSGALPVKGIGAFTLKKLMEFAIFLEDVPDQLADILNKLNDIKAKLDEVE